MEFFVWLYFERYFLIYFFPCLLGGSLVIYKTTVKIIKISKKNVSHKSLYAINVAFEVVIYIFFSVNLRDCTTVVIRLIVDMLFFCRYLYKVFQWERVYVGSLWWLCYFGVVYLTCSLCFFYSAAHRALYDTKSKEWFMPSDPQRYIREHFVHFILRRCLYWSFIY